MKAFQTSGKDIFEEGERIVHRVNGLGTVLKMYEDLDVAVEFDEEVEGSGTIIVVKNDTISRVTEKETASTTSLKEFHKTSKNNIFEVGERVVHVVNGLGTVIGTQHYKKEVVVEFDQVVKRTGTTIVVVKNDSISRVTQRDLS